MFLRRRSLARGFVPLLVVLLGAFRVAVVTADEPPTLKIGRVSASPRLADFVKGEPPAGWTRVSGLRQREPGDGTAISRETTVFLGYDQANIHAVFLCKEDPSAVRARMAKRESIEGDDLVGILLDTFHDKRHAYEFIANPLGIQLDGISSEGQDDDFSFDTLWHSEGQLTPDGYAVLMSIPFRSLRFSDARVQEWGIAVARIIPTRNETSFFPYVTRRVTGTMAQFATLTGLEGISPGRNIQVIPYGAFAGAKYLDEDAGAYGDRKEGRVGVDAKVVIKDALTLDVALNPDFSQVESDEPQVTVNQRFEVQFPEKRPFFIENASYFTTPETLFFSRRIADPQFGARITGRVGAWTVAGLVMDDQAPGELTPPEDPAHGSRAVVAVGRVVREFGRQSTIGALVTSRDFGASSNRIAAADLRLRLGDHWIVSGQAIASRTTRHDGSSISGPALLASLDYQDRSLGVESRYTDRAEGFRSEIGFVRRTDIREWENEVGYRFFPRKSRLLSWGPSFESSVIWDHSGVLQDWEFGPELEFELPAGTQVHMGVGPSYELFEGVGFRKHSFRTFTETEWLKWLSATASYRQGPQINYYPASGQPFLANGREIEVGATLRPVPPLRIEETYIHNRLTTGDTRPAGVDEGASIFTLHLFRTKANYQFTRELSLRAIVDYNVLTPDGTLVELERDKRLTVDALVTWMLNPGTALHVGYTDAYANLRVDPRLSPSVSRTDSARTSTGRQFFVKMSYLLRY